ncbi:MULTISPECIES: transporter substrate-binding domain-containing protein [Vagococcus]|uniref:transporter substrate-binding domain-containing protein n=1 Tax=Vagococcus TaxID=2737 RepID=UPI002FC6DE9C
MKGIANRKSLFIAICIGLFILTGCGTSKLSNQDTLERVEKQEKIVWGVRYDTKLFGLMDIETREVVGFDIDIAEALTKEILGENGQAEFVEVVPKTRIPLLKNGNVDGIIATMTITEERKEQVDFTQTYFDAGQSLLVKKGSDITGIEDLNGKTVLAVKGSTSAINIREHAPKANILELENYAETFTALKSGQGDAMTTDNSILYGIASENPDYELVGDRFTEEPYGIAVDKNQERFLVELDKALNELRKNGTYDEIYEKWFGKTSL